MEIHIFFLLFTKKLNGEFYLSIDLQEVLFQELGTRPGTSFLVVCNPSLRERKASMYM